MSTRLEGRVLECVANMPRNRCVGNQSGCLPPAGSYSIETRPSASDGRVGVHVRWMLARGGLGVRRGISEHPCQASSSPYARPNPSSRSSLWARSPRALATPRRRQTRGYALSSPVYHIWGGSPGEATGHGRAHQPLLRKKPLFDTFQGWELHMTARTREIRARRLFRRTSFTRRALHGVKPSRPRAL